MKRSFIIPIAVVCLVAGFVLGVRAGSGTLLASLVTLNGTTNTTSFSAGSVTVPAITYQIQNNGLASTNALTGYAQVSVDNTNFLTYDTYHPTLTNATVDVFIPSTAPQTLYFRLQLVSTNSVSVGALYKY